MSYCSFPISLLHSQIRAILMNRSSARAVISAYLFNIYAMERQIATTDTTKMRDFARLVSLRRTSMHPHESHQAQGDKGSSDSGMSHTAKVLLWMAVWDASKKLDFGASL